MHPTIEYIVDNDRQLDLTAPGVMEIEYDATRKVLYVNACGITVLRACQIEAINFRITPPRKGDRSEPGKATG